MTTPEIPNPLPPLSNESIVTLNLPISVKLTKANFLAWKSQILPVLHGYNLMRFINSPPPSTTTPSATGQIELNPQFLLWHRQDNLLLGWLRSSLTESVMTQVVSWSTSFELWHTLLRIFTSSSRSRITDLKRQIQFASKGAQSCEEFLNQIQRISDELAFIGAPVAEDELVSYTLNGLGSDYLHFITSVTTAPRNEPLTFAELHGLLLTHESVLQSFTPTQHPSTFATGRGYNPKTRQPSAQVRPNPNAGMMNFNSDHI